MHSWSVVGAGTYRWIGPALVVVCLGGCELLFGEDGESSDAGSADGGNTEGTAVTATGFAALLGIDSYDLEVVLDPDSLATIEVRDSGGGLFGEVTLAIDESATYAAEFRSHTGSTASMTLWGAEDDGGARATSVLALSFEGSSLRIVTVADAETGQPLAVSVETPLREGEAASAFGSISLRGEGTYAVLHLLEEGASWVSEERYGRWLADMGLSALLSSPEVTLLHALLEDPALIAAMLGAFADLAPDSAANKGSNFCESLRQQIRSDEAATNVACQECGQIDPAPTASYPLGFDNPEARKLYEPACRQCASQLNLGLKGMVRAANCVRLWTGLRANIAANCPSGRPAWSFWTVDGDTGECSLGCDQTACDLACSGRDELTGGRCLQQAGSPACVCEVRDVNALCAGQFGESYCGEGEMRTQTDDAGNEYRAVACVTAECGDTEINGACGQRPAEVCDPSAHEEGCGAPGMRCVDCFLPCQPCECDPFEQDCPGADAFCDGNCSCQPSGCRFSALVDLLGAGATFCDPAASDGSGSNGFCSDNQICRADTCQCDTLDTPIAEPGDTPDAGSDAGPGSDLGPGPDYLGSCSIFIENDEGETHLAGCAEYSGMMSSSELESGCQGVWSDSQRCAPNPTATCSHMVGGGQLSVEEYFYFVPFGDQTCAEQVSGFQDGCAVRGGTFSGGC